MSERDRSLFVNRYVERMEVGEIATLHQMSFSTTRRRIDRMTKLVSARAKRDDVLAGYFAPHTDLAARIVWGIGAEELSRLVRRARDRLPAADADQPRYELWRRSIAELSSNMVPML